MHGKSFVAVDLALSAAAGLPWANSDDYSGFDIPHSLDVVYIAGEHARGIAKARRPAWKKHRGIDRPLPFYLINEMPRLTNETDVGNFIADLESEASPCKSPDLIFVDTAVLALGGADENSASDTGTLIAACHKLRRTFGCSVAVIHHTGHDKKNPRGSYNFIGSFEWIFKVKAQGNQLAESGELEVIHQKTKDLAPLPPLKFKTQIAENALVLNRVRAFGRLSTERIIEETLALVQHGQEVSSSALAKQAVDARIYDYQWDSLRKAIDSLLKDELKRAGIAKLIKHVGTGDQQKFVFLGQGLPDTICEDTD